MHRLVEVDRIENPDLIPVHHKGMCRFIYNAAFVNCFLGHKNDYHAHAGDGLKIIFLNVLPDQLFHLVFQRILACFAEMKTDQERCFSALHDQTALRRFCLWHHCSFFLLLISHRFILSKKRGCQRNVNNLSNIFIDSFFYSKQLEPSSSSNSTYQSPPSHAI
jgi:hypothetical protein